MSEYIIEIPDEYFASYDTERDMYYPDERDSAMPITPFVRCRDCEHYMDYEHEYEPNLGYCREHDREEVHSMRFCAWGERQEP